MTEHEVKKIVEEEKKNTPVQWIEGGYLKLGLGSVYTYIHIEWFEKAISIGAIKKNVYSQYVPCGRIYMKDFITGRKGKETTTERREVVDLSLFYAFHESYEKWKYAREMESDRTRSLLMPGVVK